MKTTKQDERDRQLTLKSWRNKEGVFETPQRKFIVRGKSNGRVKTLSKHEFQWEAKEAYNNFIKNSIIEEAVKITKPRKKYVRQAYNTISPEIRDKVLNYFKTNKNNTSVEMSEALELSKWTISKIMYEYFKELTSKMNS